MTELIWEGKYKDGKRVAPVRIALPLQTIETINESAQDRQRTLDLFASGRESEWRNRLIWGDNKYVLPSLLAEFAGKVNLIYIDPPFDTGADFSFTATVPDHPDTPEDDSFAFTKEPSIIEQKAYRDTWGKGADSFITMIYERLVLMRDLLAEDGAIVIHMGDKVASLVRLVTADVFGENNYRNTIIIPRGIKNVQSQFKDVRGLSVGHDVLIFFSKSEGSRVKKLSLPGAESSPGKWDTFWRGTDRPTMRYELFGIRPNSGQWRWSRERAEQARRNFDEYLRAFAKFLDLADDVKAFAKLPEVFGFAIDYTDGAGNLRAYYPDFVAVDEQGTNWLLETKGQETEETKHKDNAATLWCENASQLTSKAWKYLKVPQQEFERLHPETLADLGALLPTEQCR